MITYTDSLESVTADKLTGFFVGWPKPPSPRIHLRILKNSHRTIIALDTEFDRVVGFINAISDGSMAAYIPLLEVLPEYQGQGIGTELLRRILDTYKDLYMIDLMTDADKETFYTRLGMRRGFAMMIRNFDRQHCGE